MQIGKNVNFFRWVSFSALFSSLSHSHNRELFRDFPTFPHPLFTEGWVCVWVGLASPCGHNLTNKKRKQEESPTASFVVLVIVYWWPRIGNPRPPFPHDPPLQWREGGHFSRAPRSTYVRSEGARKWNLCTSEKRMPQMVTLAGWLLWQHWMVSLLVGRMGPGVRDISRCWKRCQQS